jgi:uncharacterized membrane protein
VASGTGRARSTLQRLRGEGEKATAKGYIRLNYYNLFWIFVLGSVIGLWIETLYMFIVEGIFQSRAGLVWGPFSPLYGLGAVAFTAALNRFWDKNTIVTFAAAMLIGMTLEFLASWIMENLFGVVAWDYSGTFGNIDGRTNIAFGLMWGLLGLVWIRFLLPFVLAIISLIPFKWHIAFTIALTAFLVCDIALTLLAANRWHERVGDVPATNIIQRGLDTLFPDEWMQDSFENTTMYAGLGDAADKNGSPVLVSITYPFVMLPRF